MDITQTRLSGIWLLTPKRFGDHRGFFSETWNRKVWQEAGIADDFVQDNHSLSAQSGTLRGLHFQAPPSAQAKLVRVVAGAVLDVAVDIRRNSPTYGQWVAVELSAQNGQQLYIPTGFLHGFLTLQPDTQFVYKCSDYYDATADGAVVWNDPDIGIDWGVAPDQVVLSGKDAAAQPFATFDSPFEFKG